MASYTTNLGLVKPVSTDNFSLGTLNANYDTIDQFAGKVAVDYVTDRGTYNNGQVTWYWRKYASGIGECWIEDYETDVNLNSNYGTGLFSGYVSSPGDYPPELNFLSLPLVMVNWASVTSGVGYSCPIWAMPNGTLSQAPRIQLVDQTRGSAHIHLSYYVRGRCN